MKQTGLGPEDLALQMLGWDKENRDYAFMDNQFNDSDNSEDFSD